MKRKKKFHKLCRMVQIYMLVTLCLIMLLPAMETEAAAVTGQETSYLLINTEVGRYKFNYAGNTNFFDMWDTNGTTKASYTYNDAGNYRNSSTATLTQTPGASGIKYAFLVWETRSPAGATDPVYFITPNGTATIEYPTYAVNDWRADPGGSWASSTMYCMATNVTDIVRNTGYGNYSVCNIPRYTENGSRTAGESPGSWQLIVIEEGEDFPVRAVSLDMGARFKMGQNLEDTIHFSNGITTKSTGTATGQIFFGASNSANEAYMTERISTYNSGGAFIGEALANTTVTPGLYRNGNLINGRDQGHWRGCIRMDLSDIESSIGNSAKTIKSYVENNDWTTFFLFGTAVDIAFPDFYSYQTTSINNSESATVSGKITNISPQENTGIYDGNLTVDLDSALTPDGSRCSVKVNGVAQAASVQIVHTGDHYQVQFYGGNLANFMKGSTLEYSIDCTMNASGRTKIHNRDAFNGYLRSDGVNTGYWINKAWTSSSSAAVYTISYNPNGGSGSISSDMTGDGGRFTLKSGFSAGGYSFEGYAVVRSSDNAVFCGSLGWQPMSTYGNQPDKWTIYQPGQTYTIDGAWKNPSCADGDTFTFFAQWKLEYIIRFNGNGATGGSMSDLTCTYDESRTLPANKYTRTGYIFKGWNTKANGRGTAYTDKATVKKLANVSGATVTLYAQWTPIKYTIRFDGNGATGGSMSDMSCTYDESKTLSANQYSHTGHHFNGWNTKSDGSGTAYADKATVKNLANKNGAIVTLYAQWEANTYTIRFDPNDGGEETPISDMTVRYGEQINLPDGAGAYIKYTLDGVNVTQDVLDGTIVLDDAGAVVMRLDKESGRMLTSDGAVVNEDGSISRTNEDGTITVTYSDGTVVTMDSDGTILSDDEAADEDPAEEDAAEDAASGDSGEDEEDVSENGEVKNGDSDQESMPEVAVTSDTAEEASETTENDQTEATNETENDRPEATNETENAGIASVECKAVSRSATADDPEAVAVEVEEEVSAQTELTEDPDAEPQPNQKAYASVFMGWSLEGEKNGFVPQWTVSDLVNVSVITDMSGVTDTDGAVITLYAVWDDCPWIVAENLYYTLAQAQSGFITQDELFDHAAAYDREDGSPIASGVHDNGTSFTITDYLPADFTQFEHEGSITENLTVTDSAGSTYRKQITVYIVDTTAVAVKPEGTTRFINEYYYNQPYENGGLEENSIWKTDSEYRQVLQTAFDNMRNDTPILTFTFSNEDVQKMKAYVEAQRVGRIGQPEVLETFYDRFCAVNRVN